MIKRLYKYFPENINSIKSLAMNSLWCHTANKMNDPIECLAYFDKDFDKNELQKIRKLFRENPNHKHFQLSILNDDKLSKALNSYRKLLISKYAFCSLCEENDNILMWSHYASGHGGFVIGIDFEEEDMYQTFLTPVNYENSIPDLNLQQFGEFMLSDDQDDNFIQNIMNYLSVKTLDWKYEKEWRLWVDKPGYYRIKPEQIKEIIFGYNCPSDTQMLVSKILSYNKNEIEGKYVDIKDNPIRIEFLKEMEDIKKLKTRKKEFESRRYLDI